ncbi:MAG: dTDP-4-dehydrorhamnose 3,5-epimerase [Planctomycetota bacterium]
MQVTAMDIPDVKLIRPKKFGDARGFFMETYSQPRLEAAGVHVEFVQDNHSLSAEVGVLRGLHFQKPPNAQAKLVRVTAGRVYDVAVDIRVGSPTYGKHVGRELGPEGEQLFVPAGFLHGFVTLEPNTEFLYKVSSLYAPESDAGVLWNDPDLNIPWPLQGEPTLSGKDAGLPTFAEFQSPFVYEGSA